RGRRRCGQGPRHPGCPRPHLDAEPRRSRGARECRARCRRQGPQMSPAGEIWAVVPVKDTATAKQRLARALPPHLRQELALAMLEDVLTALAAAPDLGRRLLVTIDPEAKRLAANHGFDCIADGAEDGHTGAVMAAARRLAADGVGAMLALPGDIPLITSDE